ncbi:MAG TPA: polyprenyl synthetase family protein, partial [Pirellulaceae bacterium]|nr:polyprenyl synthetase family protein [Pirellulaceae bacterium]
MIRTSTESELARIAAPVREDWERAEQLLLEQFEDSPPWLDRLLSDRAILGGKRLRPLLLLLSGAAVGSIQHQHHTLAVAIELIHLATLVHDDLIDGATTRRQAPTVNHEHGATNSVLLGDWFYAHAFVLAAQSKSMDAVETLARSIRAVCDGEIHQHYCQGNFDLGLNEYLEMIEGKTAALCAAACDIGAGLTEARSQQRNALREYGRHLGIAFQIVDDILDLIGSPDRIGKTLGTDLANRRVTAPLLFALKIDHETEHRKLSKLLNAQNVDQRQLVTLIEEAGAIQQAWELARQH